MPKSEIAFTLEAPESRVARECLEKYVEELARLFDGGYAASKPSTENDKCYRAPLGGFVVAWLNGSPVGCGAWRRLDNSSAEIKRVWISQEVRGRGLGRRLLHEIETVVKDAGIRVLRLDTNRALVAARQMYLANGYVECCRYNDNPYAHMWFKKEISD